ncbi:MAG: SgcJ/EcaC family oxidoreductase [Myxococcales bacterium]|nr:SgcJ/EcaC family oxidoreductase [Myxococcales bacterium]
MGDPGHDLAALVRRFNDAFNRVDLDAVIDLFAVDAIYVTLEGRVRRGRAAIRRELAPQFRGVFGRLTFEELDLAVDPTRGRVTLHWRCHHDLTAAAAGVGDELRRRAWRALYGRGAVWEGIDLLHLEGGMVVEKHTFTKAFLPRARRARG